MKIFGKELTFNNNKVYHAGNKPTPSEIGAASINDSSTSTSSCWSSNKTQTEINTSYNTMTKRVEGLEETMYSDFVMSSGDTMTGGLTFAGVLRDSRIANSNKQIMNAAGDIIYVGNPDTPLQLESRTNPTLNRNGTTYTMYHSGNMQPHRGFLAESQSNSGLYKIIDLTNYYDGNWFPVVGSAMPTVGYTEIRVAVHLNSGTVPSWSTHKNGFTVNLHVLDKPGGWGTTNGVGVVLDNSYSFANAHPVGYQQMYNSSFPVLWLRGGGKYFVYTSEPITWSIKTAEYSVNSEAVTPTAAYPGVNVRRAQINANLYGDVQTPSNWIKIGQKWLTIQSTAPSASTGDVWIQI